MLILKDEHAIDVLKSGNTGHLWHDFHAIGVHATDVGHPEEDEDGLEALRTLVGSFWRIFCFCRNLGFGVKIFEIGATK